VALLSANSLIIEQYSKGVKEKELFQRVPGTR